MYEKISTDFNTRKNYGVVLRNFGEKNVFSQKYDKIRRFDSTILVCRKNKQETDNFVLL
jgi:hypothetical protein